MVVGVALIPEAISFSCNPVDATAQIVSRKGLAVVLDKMCLCEENEAVVVTDSLAGPQMLELDDDSLREVLGGTAKPVLIYSYTLPGEASMRPCHAWAWRGIRARREWRAPCAVRSLLAARPGE